VCLGAKAPSWIGGSGLSRDLLQHRLEAVTHA
jgi:predicted GNAT family acetyltransferase